MKASQPLSLLVRQLRPSIHSPPSCLSARFLSYPPPILIQNQCDFSSTSSSERGGLPSAALQQARCISASAASAAPALPASKPQQDKSKLSSSTSTVPNFRALYPSSSSSSSSFSVSKSERTSDSSTAAATTTTTTNASFPLTGERPSYQISFTCKPCLHRSTHTMTKQGYHHGTVLITCPSCKNRHVISDHLMIFADLSFTVEDLMRDKGDLVKRGSISQDGDIEFWADENGGDGERKEG